MAISLISPGIKITETDLVSSQQAVATTAGAFAGQFNWGPVDDPVQLVSENELVAQFGKPSGNGVIDFLVAANYLGYSAPLWIVRPAVTNLKNATAEATTGSGTAGTGVLIKNEETYLETASFDNGPWAAKYAGVIGNSLQVSICPNSSAWQSTLTGTWNVTAGSTTVVGTGGAANTEVLVGDILVIGNRAIKVASITNADYMTLESAHLTGATGATVTRRWEYYGEFDAAPGTSDYVSGRGGSGDEMHVVVVDEDGVITNVAGSVLEKFALLSKANDARSDNGGFNFYKDIINNQSAWIWWTDHDADANAANTWGQSATTTFAETSALPIQYSLAGGADGSAITDDERINGYNFFVADQEVQASVLIAGAASATVVNRIISDIAEVRKNIVVCVSPERSDVVGVSASAALTNVLGWAGGITRSTYVFADSGWKYQYNKYNDNYAYVPLNADSAGCMARNDLNREPWLSPAGYNNGRIQNIIKLAFNPTQADRDALYKVGINPVITQVGKGTILFGDKTFTTKNTSLNRINVRRLFIELQRTIGESADNVLFEQNDATTRTNFVNLVTPYLRSVQSRRGIDSFRVICDETNNPESVVNANEFICDIFIQPVRSVNFIQLNFISSRGEATFNEIAV